MSKLSQFFICDRHAKVPRNYAQRCPCCMVKSIKKSKAIIKKLECDLNAAKEAYYKRGSDLLAMQKVARQMESERNEARKGNPIP